MEKTYSEYAQSEEEIKAFVAACNALCEAKFLLGERKIADLLRTIAAGPRLYALFRDALDGYDRKTEFARSAAKVGNRGKLVLPQTQTGLMAYVFCLLMEIDAGKRHLRTFLDEYFYHTNPNEELALFCSTLIVPFRDVTEFVFYNGAESYSDGGAVEGTLRETAKALLAKMNELTSQSALPANLKADLFLLARAMESALTPNRIDLVKPLLIGYRRAVAGSPLCDKAEPLILSLARLLGESETF